MDVGLAAAAQLALMCLCAELVGAVDVSDLGGIEKTFQSPA